MTPRQIGDAQLILGDALKVLKTLPENSMDLCLTDPPYGLEFMGQEWDKFGVSKNRAAYLSATRLSDRNCPKHTGRGRYLEMTALEKRTYQEWTEAWAREVYRVLKPGAALLAMGGTRTEHRMKCGIEDAGFIIKDTFLWVYRAGFPKAQALDLFIDKKIIREETQGELDKCLTWVENPRPSKEYLRNLLKERRRVIGEFQTHDVRRKRGGGPTGYLAEQQGYETKQMIYKVTAPASDLAKEWAGWKIGGLKPAYEPIVYAVKPPEGSWTDNVLRWGVGGINVDENRIPYRSVEDAEEARDKNRHADFGSGPRDNKVYGEDKRTRAEQGNYDPSRGRFPANIMLTDPVFGPRDSRFFLIPKAGRAEREKGLEGEGIKVPGNWGSIRKKVGEPFVSTGDGRVHQRRNPPQKARNIHPTVKPIRLAVYLVRLFTRPGQVVLDPFMGSGSFGISAKITGRRYIGVEIDEKYFETAIARISSEWQTEFE